MKTKKCSKCKIEKSISGFSKDESSNDGLNCHCKKCNFEYHIKKRKWLDDIKVKSGCMACGYKEHPSALVFHHRNPKEKEFNLYSKNKTPEVLEEIKKCIILCANCHRLLHCSKYRNLPEYIKKLKDDLSR